MKNQRYGQPIYMNILMPLYTWIKQNQQKISTWVKLPNRKTATNSTYTKSAVSFAADSLEVAESFVLRINISGKSRQLLVPAKRSMACLFCFLVIL